MQPERFELCGDWGPRADDERECARRLAKMVSGLCAIDPVFNRWLEQTDQYFESHIEAAAACEPIFAMPPDLNEIARMFDANRTYYDNPPDKVWPEQGFWIGAWNGREIPLGLAFRVHCGAFSTGSRLVNSVNIDLSNERLTTRKPWTGTAAGEIARAVSAAWSSQSLTVWSSPLTNLLPIKVDQDGERTFHSPRPGWVTYLSAPYAALVHPPTDIKVERLPDGGMIATLCDETFDSTNPRHQRLLSAMDDALAPVQKIWAAEDSELKQRNAARVRENQRAAGLPNR